MTTAEILAAATQALTRGGYKRASLLKTFSGRVFEDEYNIVGLVAFETWGELKTTWAEAQAAFVESLSHHIKAVEPKAWDAYLILATPNPCPLEDSDTLMSIRYNTTRVRKLVGTGSELATVSDVERLVSPLLPIASEGPTQTLQDPLLTAIPDMLQGKGITRSVSEALVEAFAEQRPLLERLHERVSDAT